MPSLRRLLAVWVALSLYPAVLPLDAARKSTSKKKRKTHRRKRTRHPLPSDRVVPSEIIEQAVAEQLSRGRRILENLGEENLFESPYVVSAVYYHDGFLENFPSGREDADPGRRILAGLIQLLDTEHKTLYIDCLRRLWTGAGFTSRAAALVAPVADGTPGHRRRRSTHKHALDLFAPEGSAVRTATDGIVVLAEGGWSADDPLSTSSRRGGNAVIIFDPWQERFYRYCHLESVAVAAGQQVQAGAVIGAVGHTGLNASVPGHGRHLHFEINQYDGSSVRALDAKRLRRILEHALDEPPARVPLFLPWASGGRQRRMEG